ncbi:MAG: ATP-binding cassette domain-containing protein [Nocardioides sp.]|uniref:ABC transporter ATP-binding protein n=1 Tax=Nocardioides sp. TaxID=35761 RepID=UPI003EFF359B
MYAVECRDLRRHFGEVRAVDGIDLTVDPHEIFGLIGPNGSGKTTVLNCLQGLDRPTSGEVEVLGLHPLRDRREVNARIGVQLQSAALIPRLTVVEALRLFAALYPRSLPIEDLLHDFGLAGKAKRRIDRLSGGERQRVFVALAMLHDPELLFFDELTSAVDPQARLAIWDILRGLREQGRTIMLTTHSMEEAEALCDRVAILDEGRIIATGTPDELVDAYGGDRRLEMEVSGPVDTAPLEALAGVHRVQRDGGLLVVEGAGNFTPAVVVHLAGAGVEVTELSLERPTLEAVFINLTGRGMRDAGGA